MLLAWLAITFIAGLGVGEVVGLPAVPDVVLAAILGVLACRDARHRHLLLVLSVFLVGLARAPHGEPGPGSGDISAYNGRTAKVEGIISEEPDVRDTGVNLVVSVDRVTFGTRSRLARGKIEVHTQRSVIVDYADAVTLTGRLLAPHNDRAIPYADILARRGIFSTMRFPRLSDSGPVSTGPLGWIVRLREWLERNIDAWLPEPEAALLIAIALGAHSAALGDLAPLLVSTGLIHIIAISGIKVAMVAGTLYALASRLRAPRVALALTLLTLWWYVLLTGATVSGERSAAMWTLVFVGAVLGRATVSLVSLSAVVAFMLAADPTLLWDSAFQLTAAGTAAIVAFTPPVLSWVRPVPSPVREAFAVTLSAQFGTAPIVAIGFHVVSLIGPFANALVLPLLPALIVLGFVLGTCGSVAVLAGPVSGISYALLHAVVLLVGWMARLPGAIPVDRVPAGIVVFYYLFISGLALRTLRARYWAPEGRAPAAGRDALLALVVGALLASVAIAATRAESATDRLVWLGEGNAMLLQSGDHSVLIDGSSRPFRLLERLGAELPYDSHGIDAVIVTDPRASNVAGLRAVVQHYHVGEVLDVGVEHPSSTYASWRGDLRALRVPVFALRTGVTMRIGGITIRAVAPDGLRYRAQDSAAMVRVDARANRVMLAGIASEQEQHEAVFQANYLHADVLVAPGSGCDAAFLRQVSPRVIFSRSCRGAHTTRPLKSGSVLASFH